jgi:hypothetical protein
MPVSQVLEVVIGVVFVWFLLSMAVSAVNQAFSWLTRVRAKLLWHSLAGLFEQEVKAPDARLRTLFWRMPAGRDDHRPISDTEPSATSRARGNVAARAPEPPGGLQGLYEILIERVPDSAPKSYRSRISAVPRRAVSDALLRLAETTVTKASLLGAASPSDGALVQFVQGLPDGVLNRGEAGISSDGATVTVVPPELSAAFDRAWADAERLVTVEDLEALVTGDGALARTLRRIGETAAPEARVQQARDEIERWFDTSMQALSGFYQRQNRKIAAVVAVPIVLFTSADSVGLFQRLWTDQDRAAAATSQAAAWVAQPLEQAGGTEGIDIDQMCARVASTDTATTTAPPDASADEISVGEAVDEARRRLACASELVGSTDLVTVIGPVGLWREMREDGRVGYGLPGRMLTWGALLFGASFWFDVLRRLVGWRGPAGRGGSGPDG